VNLSRLKIAIKNIKDTLEAPEDKNNLQNNLKVAIEDIKTAFKRSRINNELEKKISNIREVFLENWKEEKLPFVKEVTNITNRGIPLPVLSICGKGTREIRFTKYLAYFLDPSKNHGLKDEFLKETLRKECEEANLPSNWHESCEVKSEMTIGEIILGNEKIACCSDISIIGENFVIIIEHKILSSESSHSKTELRQLERYSLALNNNYPDKKQVKIYLTPEERSKDYPDGWITLTHRQLISRGMQLLSKEKTSKVAKENLLRLLIDLAIGPYEILEDSLNKMNCLGNRLLNKDLDIGRILKFNKLVEENELIIKLLTEV